MRRILLFVPLLGVLGCSLLTDPAVQIARCTERAAKSLARSGGDRAVANCPPHSRIHGQYLVVLHPEGQLSDEELIQGGVPPGLLPFLRKFRLGDSAAVYVFPGESARAASRTTYQKRFVHIPRLFVLERETRGPVRIAVAETPRGKEIVDLE
jgi:hypothetical protein